MARLTPSILLLFIAHSTAVTFDEWAVKYGKSYPTAEAKANALTNFQNSLLRVKAQNSLFVNGASTSKAGLNAMSDMTPDEFLSAFTMPLSGDDGDNCSTDALQTTPKSNSDPIPDFIDWREAGAVIEIKDQGSCGSCWAFSATGALESQNFLVNGLDADGQLVVLSEQQLIDCAQAFGNFGCSGGYPANALEYVKYSQGLDTEESYPYIDADGNCTFNPASVGAKVEAVTNITYLDEDQIVESVALTGPVSFAFHVATDFMHYESGVYANDVCRNKTSDLNHAVVAIGYDKTLTQSALPYFIAKNSWGTDWGIEGYFWIELGTNMCGLADCASFPTAAKI